jgi:hypothetical protein
MQTTQPIRSCSSGTVGRLNYQDYEDLSVIISSSAAITLTFNVFDTEEDYDKITVSSCTTTLCSEVNVLLDGYSGSTIPGPVTSTTGIMLIVWKSDEIYTFSGWDAVFATECQECLPGTYSSSEGYSDCAIYSATHWHMKYHLKPQHFPVVQCPHT